MKIFIFVEGGIVQGVRATEKCEVVVWDQDMIEDGCEPPLNLLSQDLGFEENFKEIEILYPEVAW